MTLSLNSTLMAAFGDFYDMSSYYRPRRIIVSRHRIYRHKGRQ